MEATDYIIEMNRNLGEINSKIGSLCETLAKHEQRICNLENHPNGKTNHLSKESINKYLVIALIGCISVIVTLTGSASILKVLIGG